MCAIMSINRWFCMLISQARDGRPNSAANPLPTPQNSAAGGLGQIVSKLLIFLYSWMLEGRFSGGKMRFLPDGRDMRRGPGRPDRAAGLLRRQPAIDHKPGAGHEGGVVGGEKDDA